MIYVPILSIRYRRFYQPSLIFHNMNILSLFDWISCGRLALERAWIQVDKYFASEIDKHAIQIAKKNYPDTIHIGSVTDVKWEDYKGIDLLIGGSPCQSFSSAWKREWFDGESWLFFEYIRILLDARPKYFLLENVVMKKEWEDLISAYLWVSPIKINSSLVSWQKRKRLYWTNITWIKQPNDLWILCSDIIDDTVTHTYLPESRSDYSNYDRTLVDLQSCNYLPIHIGSSKTFGNSVSQDWKAFTLRKSNPNWIITKDHKIRYFTPIEAERLQTLPDNYTNVNWITNNQRYSAIGNWWTVDVISHIFSYIK